MLLVITGELEGYHAYATTPAYLFYTIRFSSVSVIYSTYTAHYFTLAVIDSQYLNSHQV